MCDFCKGNKHIFSVDVLDGWSLPYGPITEKDATHSKMVIFIDRGWLRMVEEHNSECLFNGDRTTINYCPFCGTPLTT